MAEQLHYASVPAGASGRAGFQFTARSGPVAAETERLVERFMTYRPPSGVRSAGECPVSLAYDRTPWGAIVVCCRYLGTDYTGRPGNFLGHAVLVSHAEVDGLRPIELWKAPFWARTPARSLAPLHGLPLGGAVDPERVSGLMSAGGTDSLDLLAALVDAVRDTLAGRAGPVTLIGDDVDRIALWIAAVSYSLPMPVTRDLSFVTYSAEPRAAQQHLVGTTPGGAAGVLDGAAYRVDPPRPDPPRPGPSRSDRPRSDPPRPAPSPYAAAVGAAWRRGDLAELDTLCALAATGLTAVAGGTARGGGLDAAATLLALCRAQPAGSGQGTTEPGSVFQLLDSLADKDRVRLADAAAGSLAVAGSAHVEALLSGDAGGRIARLLSQRDWSDAPHVGRLLRAAQQRRNGRDTTSRPDRRTSPPASGAPGPDGGHATPPDQPDTPADRYAALIDDVGCRQALADPAVRRECARALATVDVADRSWLRLARAIADGYDELHPDAMDTTPDRPGQQSAGEAPDLSGLTAAGRTLLGAVAVTRGCTTGVGTTGVDTTGGCTTGVDVERLAGDADLLARWHPYAEPGLAQQALRRAARALGELPPSDRAEVLRRATPVTRNLLVTDWLAHLPDDRRIQVDLAELGIRLRDYEVTVEPLVAFLSALAARPLVLRRVYRALRRRDPRLADGLRRVVREAVADWRGLVLGHAGEPR